MPSANTAKRETNSSRLGRWLFAILIPASALAIGSVHRISLICVSIVAVTSLVLTWRAPLPSLPRNARSIVWAGLLLLTFTAIQALPLPHGVVRALAPSNADIWARSLAPLGEQFPALHSISVAPTATMIQLLRGFVYLAIFLIATRIVASDGASFVERIIVLSATLMGLVALAHPAVGADKVLGIYRPRNLYAYPVNYYAPLLNTNHLAAYLNIGVCVAFASLLGPKPFLPRPLLAAISLFLTGTSIWAASRGAMGGLALGIVTIAALTFSSRRRSSYRVGHVGAAVLVATASAILIGLASSEMARNELTNHDLGKLSIARDALRLAMESPWFGFGRGAFEDIFFRVRTEPSYWAFTHPENIVAQWVSEWGAPVSIAAAATFVWALRPSTVLTSVRPGIGAWTAVVVSVVHDLVDFHLEIPGVMIAVATCAAIAVSRRQSTVESAPTRQRVLGLSVAVVAAAVLVLFSPAESLADDRDLASSSAVDPSVDPGQFRAQQRAAMLRHPSEPFLPLMGAVRAQTFGENSVVVWVEAALERYPRFGRAHFVLARHLARAHAAQARLEYRLAFENDVDLRTDSIREGAKLVGGINAAKELVVDGMDGEPALELLSQSLAPRLPSTAFALDVEALRRDPNNEAVLLRRANDGISDAANRHPWCEKENCLGTALTAIDAVISAHPNDCEPRILRAKVLTMSSEDLATRERAFGDLVASLDSSNARTKCHEAVLKFMNDAGEDRYVDATLESLIRGGCGSAEECLDLDLWAAHFEEHRHRNVSALAFYKRASDLRPERDDILEVILRLELDDDLIGEAQTVAELLHSRHPESPQRAALAASLAERRSLQQLRGGRGLPVRKDASAE